jgi:hypothetical protein
VVHPQQFGRGEFYPTKKIRDMRIIDGVQIAVDWVFDFGVV